MSVGAQDQRAASPALRRERPSVWRIVAQIHRRLGWGVADQAVSSITNFAMSLYIARELGAVVFGAFTLAYVTYGIALNASRGLTTDPLLVRFSALDETTWRAAVGDCTGTSAVVGCAAGACACLAAVFLDGNTRLAFLALGLTLPALLLQDSWRFAFFAAGRGKQALLNDTVWASVLLPVLLLLRLAGEQSVFWCVFAWGASAGVAAAVGPLQARVVPKFWHWRKWLFHHRDLGPRYLLEGAYNSVATQMRSYGISLLLGLAALGYVQAASTLMGPVMVVYFAMGLVLLPEAVRIRRESLRRLARACLLTAAGLSLVAVGCAAVLLIGMPMGLGHLLIGSLWRPTYPLILPFAIQVVGGCVAAGASLGLHALGVARRSMRAMVVSSSLTVVGALVGAATSGAVGAVLGMAAASWVGVVMFWGEFRAALRDADYDLLTSLSPAVRTRLRRSPVVRPAGDWVGALELAPDLPPDLIPELVPELVDHGALERSEGGWAHVVRSLEEGRIVAVVDHEADPETLLIW